MQYRHLNDERPKIVDARIRIGDSDDELAAVEYRLNSRPRKRLGWMSPSQAMSVAIIY